MSRIYLIQDTRSYLGDSVMWWGPNRSGYTCRVDKAGRYSEEEARRIEGLRGTEKAFPLDVVERATSRHVLAGDLRKESDVPEPDPVAPTEPGPTERVDVSRRYHYDPVSGVFVLPYGDHLAGLQASPLNMAVHGLRVRIVYTYAPADREAAEDVARVWEERLRERGAMGVDMVGEAER